MDILNNVLEMARIENEKIVIEEELVDMSTFDDTFASIFESDIKKKNLNFFLDHSEATHRFLYMDKTHVCEIMLNLISNSIKYTPDGGTIKVAIRDLPGDDDSHCIVESTFENTGIGMSEKILAYAFEIFSREHTTENIIANTPITDNKQFKGMRILLAEDNVLNTEIAIDILSDEGFTVDNVGDGLAYVDKLQSSPAKTYDLILMDIQMPVMDGYKATETIRALPDPELANIPIVAMTANAFKEGVIKPFL